MEVLHFCRNCFYFKGYGRGNIIDIQKGKNIIVPNAAIDMITRFNNCDEETILNSYNFEFRDTIKEYINFLASHEIALIIPIETTDCFSNIFLDFEFPARLSNIVVEDASSEHLEYLIANTDQVNCEYIKLIFTKKQFTENNYTTIKGLSINCELLFTNPDLVEKNLITIILQDPDTPVTLIKIFNSLAEEMLESEKSNLVIYTYSDPTPLNGVIIKNELHIDIKLVLESLSYNSYANRKVAITSNGDLKNYLVQSEIFGNIKDTSLITLTENSNFKKIFYIKKDIIDVCRDCEFRHMCVDACLPLQRENGSWYRSKECNYNPYICKWEGEEGYKTLAECGVICDASGYSIDEEKIAEINETLWAE